MARKIIPTGQLLEKYKTEFFDALNGQSPLACALIATAFIENALMTLLGNFFIEGSSTVKNLLKPGNALGDLAKCADVVYCLGFINGAMLNNIKCIGDIRNVFAHSHEVMDFNHPSLEEFLSKMTFPKFSQDTPKGRTTPFEELAKTPRDKFSLVSQQLFTWIMFGAMEVKRQEAKNFDHLW